LFVVLNLLVAIPLLASYLVPYVNTGFFWYGALLGLLYPYLLLLNIVFLIFWLFFKKRYLLLSLVVILTGIKVHNNYFQFKGNETGRTDGIRVLSYNVNHFYQYLDNRLDDYTIIDFIAEQEADLICLQETKLQRTGELNPSKLKNRFSGIRYQHLAHQSTWHGPVIFSKYPIVQSGEIRFENTNNLIVFSDLLVNSDTIRVYNCHLQSFGIRPDDYSVIDTLGFQQKKIEEMKAIGLKLRDGYRMRSPQVDSLRKHIEQCFYPVIVCGDFNDTPVSYTYSKMRKILNDAFVESGVGISNTYRGKLPPNRIDYIFYSNDFEAFNYRRHKIGFSDHYPVSALLIKKE
jgi:endonuclease/exonuclease/phosphatase family metal-dependent hydrolase